MLCTIESLKRILESQKELIKIGNTTNDDVSIANAEQSIREADAIINGMLQGVYQLPLRNRDLLPKTSISSPKSLVYQPESPRQLAIIINSDDEVGDGDKGVSITGTDAYGTAITETFIFDKPGTQVTANYFKTVDADGIIVGDAITSLDDAYFIILSYDILNYVCQRLASYNLYRDIFSANSPNDVPDAVEEWREEAYKILNKIKEKTITLDNQFAPSDIPQTDRPVYNLPVQFFGCLGVAGIERLENSDIQACDSNTPHSDDSEGSGSSDVTVYTQVIIPPGNWTNSTRPAAPYPGQSGWNTESKQFEGWNESEWVIIG